ncbi:MAG: AAA family ATPase [Firmicutes bacterium]|nr:AAA family ATPase [Bacillota bacterium]
MRIEGATIKGFGVFCNQHIDDLGDGVVLFTGMNEAGKSTLLQFFVSMLFGARRRVPPPYPPLRGGAHAGIISITMQDGTARTVHRTLSGPDRYGPIPELQGMSRELYTNVFAFGLPELVDLERITGEEVASRIFSAGAGLGAEAYARARELLVRGMEELGTRSSRTRPINQACDRLNEALRRVEEIRRQQGKYSELLCQLEANERARAELAERAEWLSDQAAWLGQLARTRDLWESVVAAEAALKSMAAEIGPDDERLLSVAEAIDSLESSLPRWLKQVSEVGVLQVKLDGAELRVRDLLNRLGPDWTEERVAAFDTSLEVRQQVRKYGDDMEAAGRAVELAKADVEAALRTVQECLRAHADVEAEMERHDQSRLPAESEAKARLEAASAARAALARLNEARAKHLAAVGRLEGASQAARWAAALAQASPPGTPWAAVVVIVAALVTMVVAVSVNQPLLFLGALMLGIAAAARAMVRSRRRRLGDGSATSNEAQEARQQAEKAAAEAKRCEEAVLAAEQELKERMIQAGLSTDTCEPRIAEALSSLEEQTREHLAVHRELGGLRVRLKRTADHLKAAQEELEARRRELEKAQDASADARRRWAEWLCVAGLNDSHTPESALDLLETVDEARAAQSEAESCRRLLEQAKAEVQSYMEKASELGIRGDAPPGDVQKAVASLAGKLAEARGRRADLDRAREKLVSLSTALDAAYPEELRSRARDDHSRLTAEQIEQLAQEAEERLAAVRDEMEELAGERAVLMQRKASMEGEDALQVAQVQAESARQELAQLVRHWARLAVCRRLLDAAVRTYETQRQPRMMQEASKALAGFTGGRWTRVVARISELNRIDVQDERGESRSTHQLSYGTQQQLYLAVRYGLVKEYLNSSEPLPVILDDVLVNFDPERARAAARVLSELSSDCQVLVFTCHPHMARYFLDTGRVSSHFVLDDGAIRRLGVAPA